MMQIFTSLNCCELMPNNTLEVTFDPLTCRIFLGPPIVGDGSVG